MVVALALFMAQVALVQQQIAPILAAAGLAHLPLVKVKVALVLAGVAQQVTPEAAVLVQVVIVVVLVGLGCREQAQPAQLPQLLAHRLKTYSCGSSSVLWTAAAGHKQRVLKMVVLAAAVVVAVWLVVAALVAAALLPVPLFWGAMGGLAVAAAVAEGLVSGELVALVGVVDAVVELALLAAQAVKAVSFFIGQRGTN